MIVTDCPASEIYQNQCLLGLNPQPNLFCFFLTSKKKKMSFERGFHFINTLQVAKRIIKTRSEPLRKNYSQKEAGMNPESTELTSSSHLSLFYTVSEEVPASVERGKG